MNPNFLNELIPDAVLLWLLVGSAGLYLLNFRRESLALASVPVVVWVVVPFAVPIVPLLPLWVLVPLAILVGFGIFGATLAAFIGNEASAQVIGRFFGGMIANGFTAIVLAPLRGTFVLGKLAARRIAGQLRRVTK
jgi:hypothetical protein